MKVLDEVAGTDMLQLKIDDISAREHLADCSELLVVVRCIRHDHFVPLFGRILITLCRPRNKKIRMRANEWVNTMKWREVRLGEKNGTAADRG
jgi:hypothetical protein